MISSISDDQIHRLNLTRLAIRGMAGGVGRLVMSHAFINKLSKVADRTTSSLKEELGQSRIYDLQLPLRYPVQPKISLTPTKTYTYHITQMTYAQEITLLVLPVQ